MADAEFSTHLLNSKGLLRPQTNHTPTALTTFPAFEAQMVTSNNDPFRSTAAELAGEEPAESATDTSPGRQARSCLYAPRAPNTNTTNTHYMAYHPTAEQHAQAPQRVPTNVGTSTNSNHPPE